MSATKMTANYHAHTTRCHHATGSQREYIEKAIAAGYKVFGFSDHTPYPFGNGYVSSIRMLPDELEGYVKETLALKDEYKDDIEIKLGLEVEYYPRHFDALMKLCEPYPFDYLILGQHNTDNEYDGKYVGFMTDDEEILKRYCEQIYEALDTGKFMYLAHPDLVNFTGDSDVYKRYMRQLCKKLKEYDVPGEINLYGIKDGRNYPDERFWRIAGEEGIGVVIGIDCHAVENLYMPECEEKAFELIERFKLNYIERLI